MSDCNDVKKSSLLALAIFFVITGVLHKTTPLKGRIQPCFLSTDNEH